MRHQLRQRQVPALRIGVPSCEPAAAAPGSVQRDGQHCQTTRVCCQEDPCSFTIKQHCQPLLHAAITGCSCQQQTPPTDRSCFVLMCGSGWPAEGWRVHIAWQAHLRVVPAFCFVLLCVSAKRACFAHLLSCCYMQSGLGFVQYRSCLYPDLVLLLAPATSPLFMLCCVAFLCCLCCCCHALHPFRCHQRSNCCHRHVLCLCLCIVCLLQAQACCGVSDFVS